MEIIPFKRLTFATSLNALKPNKIAICTKSKALVRNQIIAAIRVSMEEVSHILNSTGKY